MRIRRARTSDAGVLAKMIRGYESHEHALDHRLSVSSVSSHRTDILKQFKDKSSIFLIAEENGDAAGFVLYSIDKRGKLRIGVLHDIFVYGHHRGEGIGYALVKTSISDMNDHGCSYVKSAVRVKNKAAQRFWQSLGFKIDFNLTTYSMKKNISPLR